MLATERECQELRSTLRATMGVAVGGGGPEVSSEVLAMVDPSMSMSGFDEAEVLSGLRESKHVV